jgi:hypothetical protein
VIGGIVILKTASLFRNHGMQLFTQPVHILPFSNLTMKGNTGTSRILYHDIAAQTFRDPHISLLEPDILNCRLLWVFSKHELLLR